MKLKFWGTRGSIPVSGKQSRIFGGNTSCIEVQIDDTLLIFDAGTGLRELGISLMGSCKPGKFEAHMFISHTHWDHIQGFPYFIPAYIKGNKLTIYGSYSTNNRPLEKIFRGQMDRDYFPKSLEEMSSEMIFVEIKSEKLNIGEIEVQFFYLNHPSNTLAFRVSHKGKSFVYATDHEPAALYLHESPNSNIKTFFNSSVSFKEFIQNTDLYICDAQYTDEEYQSHKGWGHSKLSDALNFGLESKVKAIALFHHDPSHSDVLLKKMEKDAKQLVKKTDPGINVFSTYDRMEFEI